MFRPRAPFFRRTDHKRHVLYEYRKLLRQASQFEDPVERTYLWSWIRERFHHHKRQTSPKQAATQLSDGVWASLVISAALGGAADQKLYINDLAYGRTGYLKGVAQAIHEFHHPTKPCQMVRDVRPRSARIHQPHRAYWIPLDLRAFPVPQHLLDRIAAYDERDRQRELERRRRRDLRLAKEIKLLTSAVNQGSSALRDSGLLPEAFTSTAIQSPYRVSGMAGNSLWVPPTIKNCVDPPFVQRVRTSSAVEMYRVNGRKPPHWLGAKIAFLYQRIARKVILHEYYYYLAQDLKLEEEFEAQLGISDPGYWIFASNYRDYLRNKIKESSGQSSVDVYQDAQDDSLDDGDGQLLLENAMQDFADECK
ncbi:hypothetical protein H4S02_006492 [Coemansia sp. RSA 2611]|nr:hypothetical protein H4S02_006492 [Coemansia sp. RSA 2611]